MEKDAPKKTILCISCYFKGSQFLETAHAEGHKVLLLTSETLKSDPWPWECINEAFFVAGDQENWNMAHVKLGLAHVLRKYKIDMFVALDDYDVEKAAELREEFRVPGMGQTRARYFRDKLAMRLYAAENGLNVPPFSPIFHNDEVNHYLDTVPGPWVLKPRSAASAVGIKKLHNKDEAWHWINQLGDERHHSLLEQFLPGTVYHVDALTANDKVLFARAHQYKETPMSVAHDGGIFRTQSMPFGSPDEKQLLKENRALLKGFGMKTGASHTEFIKADADGKFYFLETSARVGGANIVEMLEASSGINLWSEWAKLELNGHGNYMMPKPEKKHSGIVICLAKQEHPDTSDFNDPEIVWRMNKSHHVGLVVASESHERVSELLDGYVERFKEMFLAIEPIKDRPTS